jgi:hypothetical protein
METEDQLVPKRNNFDDLQDYYLKCGICQALAKYRDPKGWSPSVCRSILIDLLRFNDNTNNKVYRLPYYLEYRLDLDSLAH